ncbi:MAG: isocitrate/isopropylmalate family dehydrogenase [Bacteroides sp.]|nr:isocitrate/isopropylmalate family dehydrogenase [Bacillota bacterium]MCM1393560.1 isocitrate/isopropylmalate family dehydrogenase [[Eubacterium] siraeum]MCM1455021.1 isocitrate/isopropylmalate family dehydrogenase [Bacteroides sp.]
MTYNVLIIKDNGAKCESAMRILKDVGQKFSRDFAFEICDVSASSDEIIGKAKSAHAVLLEKSPSALRKICKGLGLYASVRKVGERLVVNDAFGGIYDGDKGFRNNPTFGREAYDRECYSELEIERVARIAYELTPTRHITLIDKADELATSKLWRKIVTDINEDYPFVGVDMLSIENAMSLLLKEEADTLLAPHLFADIIVGALSTKADVKYSALLGDTALGMYVLGDDSTNVNNFRAAQQSKRNEVAEVAEAAAFMLRHSFDMQKEADYVESLK